MNKKYSNYVAKCRNFIGIQKCFVDWSLYRVVHPKSGTSPRQSKYMKL